MGFRPAVKPGRVRLRNLAGLSFCLSAFAIMGSLPKKQEMGREYMPVFANNPIEITVTPTAPAKTIDIQQLDELTGGAFSAPTSGERTARVRDWLASDPAAEQLQWVYKELSVKDKGAAKPLRAKLDEIRRASEQEAIVNEWAAKAKQLLAASRMNMADALAWQRDAAKAGAPLSREPLAELKTQLLQRVNGIEDLQHRVQVQREAAVLLAQRIEVLSTKPWQMAQEASDALQIDVTAWQARAQQLQADGNWSSVDAKFPPLLETSRAQLDMVWDAFLAALKQAQRAAEDSQAPLPSVPVWADELRQARGEVLPLSEAAKPAVDPALRAQASQAVNDLLLVLEQELSQGHGKASAGAAASLRHALKEHGRHLDVKLDKQAHAALAAAGELEGWQRWRADQLREELVVKAEGLTNRPPGQALGGRKLQETLRSLREQWKQTDQGGVANHALWKRFDEACNQAYKQVEVWLEKLKAQTAEARQQRLALIEELNKWAASHPGAEDGDWKSFHRELQRFSDRWREAGHLGEKTFAEMQAQWKAAWAGAAAPLHAVQQSSLQRRQAMIDEATALGAAPVLRIDAVKALQQRWQAEAHAVPLDRRQEQKLWDAFRHPLDEAFSRKTAEREKAVATTSEHDRQVIEAARALEAANQSGDAAAIRAALQALEVAMREGAASAKHEASESPSTPKVEAAEPSESQEPSQADTATPAPPKSVVAVRGDDRPGAKRTETAARGGQPAVRRDVSREGGPGQRQRGREAISARPMPPRLGDAAFRAQRDARERADLALRKLAAQAHGETLAHLLTAWEKRDASLLPAAQELGRGVTGQVRAQWVQSLSAAPQSQAIEDLLRLEIAAEIPTQAADLDARRALQLQLLTRRNDPSPLQTWGQDVAKVLASAYDADRARRLQNILKILLKR